MLCERFIRLVKEYFTVPGVVVAFAATYVLMLAVNAGQAGAAWVQAIGSIAAILVATRIAGKQYERDQEWRAADRAENNYGMAIRLFTFVGEYHRLVCSVLPNGISSVNADIAVAGLLVQHKSRLDRNFDNDLDRARQVLINRVRSDLGSLIYTLQHRTGCPEGRKVREGDVERAKQKAEESLAHAAKLYLEARLSMSG